MGQHCKFPPGIIVPSPALITPFPFNTFPNILAANIPNNIRRNLPFYSFASFIIVLLILFINNPDSSVI